MKVKTNKTKFRRYLNDVGSYRSHWITAFNILEFNKGLSDVGNYTLFSSFCYDNTWKNIKKLLFIMGYEVKEDLKIKKCKEGNK